MTLNPTRSKVRVTNHFETSASTDPKMTLNPTRSKVPHMCVTNVPESHIKLHFVLRPPFLKYKVVDNRRCSEGPRMTMNTSVKSTAVIQIFVCFTIPPAVFEIQGCWKYFVEDISAWPFPRQTNIDLLLTAMLLRWLIVKVPNMFNIWQIARKSNSLYSALIATLSGCKVWLELDEIVGEVAFWKSEI